MRSSPAHGYDDDPETRRLLRAVPRGRALRWVGSVLGGVVTAVHPLPGGRSSAVHVVTVVDDRGERQVVLRRYVRPELNVEEPDIADREAAVLRLVEPIPLPTPSLLALDGRGTDADVPALLMSLLPGRVDWTPGDLGPWLRGLAELLPVLHGVDVPGGVQPYASYDQESYAPPVWATRPKVWERAVRELRRPTPASRPVLLHRDFHPGNVLWDDGRVTGLVDWQSASVGPAAVDVGHCRVNLVRRFGLDVADEFTRCWERSSGDTYDPWGDVAALVGMLDELPSSPPATAQDLEEMLARAVT